GLQWLRGDIPTGIREVIWEASFSFQGRQREMAADFEERLRRRRADNWWWGAAVDEEEQAVQDKALADMMAALEKELAALPNPVWSFGKLPDKEMDLDVEL